MSQPTGPYGQMEANRKKKNNALSALPGQQLMRDGDTPRSQPGDEHNKSEEFNEHNKSKEFYHRGIQRGYIATNQLGQSTSSGPETSALSTSALDEPLTKLKVNDDSDELSPEGSPPETVRLAPNWTGPTPPAMNQSTANQPTANQPAANQPFVNQPIVNRPIVNQPIVNQPIVNRPTANKESKTCSIL